MNIRKKNLLVIALVFMVSFFFISPSNTVMATPVEYITGWDDVASGISEGESDYLEFFSTGTDAFFRTTNTNYQSSPNAFYIQDSGKGYWNLTENIDYINKVSFTQFGTVTGSIWSNTMSFYNGSDIVIQIVYSSYSMAWIDVATGGKTLIGNIGGRYYFNFLFWFNWFGFLNRLSIKTHVSELHIYIGLPVF